MIAVLAFRRVSADFIVGGAKFQSRAALTWKLNLAHNNFEESLSILVGFGLRPAMVAVDTLWYGSSRLGCPTTFRLFHTSVSFICAASWLTDRRPNLLSSVTVLILSLIFESFTVLSMQFWLVQKACQHGSKMNQNVPKYPLFEIN